MDIDSVKCNGEINVRFIIEKDGHAGRPEITGCATVSQQAALVKAIDQMPHWKPAMRNEEPVETEYRFSFRIRY